MGSLRPIRVGPFVLHEPIGRGGMGEVWSGVHEDEGLAVAVKVLTSDVAKEPMFVDAFRVEVDAVARLDHPNVATVFDHGILDDEASRASGGMLPAQSPYLVMELASRGALRLSGHAWSEVLSMLLALLAGLAHAHARGVVHRDLKPANVLLADDGLRLADFGLAHVADRRSRTPSMTVPDLLTSKAGTPNYMAPEQVIGDWRSFGPWTDLYAVGCLGWALSTGKPPFASPDRSSVLAAHVQRPLPPFTPVAPVPDGFGAWLARLLAKDPIDRYRWAADAAADLVGLGPAAPSDGTLPKGVDSVDDTLVLPPPTMALPSVASFGRPGRRSAVIPVGWAAPEVPVRRALHGAGLGLYGLRTVPVVDRHAVRDVLWRALRAVDAEKGCRAVALVGPAGHGKSRLAWWLAERAHEVGFGSTLKVAQGGAGGGVAAMVGQALGCLGLDRGQIAARLRAMGARERWDAPADEADALTELVSPATDEERRRGLRAVRFGGERERLVLIERFVRRMAEDRRVLVWLDDADQDSQALRLAAHLLREGTRALIVLTLARAEEAPAGAEVVEVGPLAPADHRTLVRELLALSGEEAAGVEARTAGNPLFAVQLVGDWVHRGVLVPGERGFVLREGASAVIPDDLHATWTARVEEALVSSPPADGLALEVAAALGQVVDLAEWRASCAVAPSPELLGRLFRLGLARRDQEGFTFVHGMLAESLRRRAAAAGRLADHHRACAAMLALADAPGRDARRGRHLVEAGDLALASEPLRRGVVEATLRAAYDESWSLLRMWRGALDGLGVGSGDERRVQSMHLETVLHRLQGRFREARSLAERLVADARGLGPGPVLAAALVERAVTARQVGEVEESLAWLLEAAPLLATDYGQARCHAELGWHSSCLGRLDDADRWFALAGRQHEAAGELFPLAQACTGRALVMRQSGRDLDEASRLLERARSLHVEAGTRRGVADVLNELGDLRRFQGDLEAATEHYRGALALYEALGSGEGPVAQVNLGLVLIEQDHADLAREVLVAAEAALASQGREMITCVATLGLLVCDALDGRFDRWAERTRDVRTSLRALGYVDVDIARLADRAGRAARRGGAAEGAREAFGLAAEQWERLGRTAEALASRAGGG